MGNEQSWMTRTMSVVSRKTTVFSRASFRGNNDRAAALQYKNAQLSPALPVDSIEMRWFDEIENPPAMGSMSNMILVTQPDRRQFHVHSDVVCRWSVKLAGDFQAFRREEDSLGICTIHLPSIDGSTLIEVLRYCYLRHPPIAKPNAIRHQPKSIDDKTNDQPIVPSIVDILHAADELHIDRLRAFCEQQLLHILKTTSDVSDVVRIAIAADRHRLTGLRSLAVRLLAHCWIGVHSKPNLVHELIDHDHSERAMIMDSVLVIMTMNIRRVIADVQQKTEDDRKQKK